MPSRNLAKSLLILGFVFGLALLAKTSGVPEEVAIRILFLQGSWMEGRPGLEGVTVMTTESTPALAELKTIAEMSESEQKMAVTEALLDALDLRTLEDLFLRVLTWDGKDPGLSDNIVRKSVVFRFILIPKRISPQEIAMRVTLEKSKEGSLGAREPIEKEVERAIKVVRDKTMMEPLLDQVFGFALGNPVIVGIPYKDRVYFMIVWLTSGRPSAEPKDSKEPRRPAPTEILEAPKPTRKVLPAYPQKLRQEGVEGVVKLRISINQKGQVFDTEVLKSLHPYLDYSASQALRKWEFEPVYSNEKPVPVSFMVAVNFDPETWNLQGKTTEAEKFSPPGLEPAYDENLRTILDRCAEYCDRLNGLALDFICEETIRETHYNFGEGGEWLGIGSSLPTPLGVTPEVTFVSTPLFDPELTTKNSYICDYLLIKKGEKLEERRILLQEDGRKMADRETLLEMKKFSVLRPFFAPIRLLDRGRQPIFSYTLIKEEKVNRKKTYLIEAVPKSVDTAGVQGGRIWVDVENFQILRCEIDGIPFEGYDDILEDCIHYYVEPFFTTTYLYQIERKGVLFPSRAETRVVYGTAAKTKLKKMKTDITYKKYKIFTVETDQEVIKKMEPARFLILPQQEDIWPLNMKPCLFY
jgi:TonB family protein